MPEVTFRFHGSLNDFLTPERRGASFRRDVPSHSSLKDAIEALGVPHPEIGRVVVDGRAAALDERVVAGSSIDVYPFPGEVTAAEPGPRFVLDGHLGRLARYLRILGVDAAYDAKAADVDLAERAVTEGRVLLTRDVGLLKRGRVSRGYWLRAEQPEEQLAEVVRRFGLLAVARPFGRCLRCNAELETVDREEVVDRLPPRTRREFAEFRRCPACSRIYWKGSHYDRMRRLLARLVEQLEEPSEGRSEGQLESRGEGQLESRGEGKLEGRIRDPLDAPG
ncbi:MAG TPA: Mut7-C RNAse domain-containing protein [Candidatus Binatia bacterium]|nr:Mut7-C RNAse domain-containing protein [Candidatus Binatia bacterium]